LATSLMRSEGPEAKPDGFDVFFPLDIERCFP